MNITCRVADAPSHALRSVIRARLRCSPGKCSTENISLSCFAYRACSIHVRNGFFSLPMPFSCCLPVCERVCVCVCVGVGIGEKERGMGEKEKD